MTTTLSAGRGCDVAGCPGPHSARGWCNRHYQQWRRWGDPLGERPNLVERFWAKVNKDGPIPPLRPDLGPCWVWTGCRHPLGYGQFSLPRDGGPFKHVAAHRFAYELLIGPVPDGLELDHLCRHPPCVNPAHNEPVTHEENMRRSPHQRKPGGWSPPGDFQRAKTHCPQSHPYDTENTGVRANGHRYCRACARDRMRRRSTATPGRTAA